MTPPNGRPFSTPSSVHSGDRERVILGVYCLMQIFFFVIMNKIGQNAARLNLKLCIIDYILYASNTLLSFSKCSEMHNNQLHILDTMALFRLAFMVNQPSLASDYIPQLYIYKNYNIKLITRVYNLYSNWTAFLDEILLLKKIFTTNGYPSQLFDKITFLCKKFTNLQIVSTAKRDTHSCRQYLIIPVPVQKTKPELNNVTTATTLLLTSPSLNRFSQFNAYVLFYVFIVCGFIFMCILCIFYCVMLMFTVIIIISLCKTKTT